MYASGIGCAAMDRAGVCLRPLAYRVSWVSAVGMLCTGAGACLRVCVGCAAGASQAQGVSGAGVVRGTVFNQAYILGSASGLYYDRILNFDVKTGLMLKEVDF